MRIALETLFWLSAALLVWAQAGYAAALALAARILPSSTDSAATAAAPPARVAIIVAAHDEAAVIARRVENLRQLDHPHKTIVVSCDACTDDTAARARAAGADIVLELAARGGKIRAQDAAVEHVGEDVDVLAFTDANSLWEPDALTHLIRALHEPRVGYACGVVHFTAGAGDAATNQEGVYWRYEMAIRARESRLASITAGNGAIYATRREAYINVDPIMGHDLSFPFNMVKRGWRAVHVPQARATEAMVPSIEGEFARKRRMMSHTWPIVLRGGMLDPRGYGVRYATMILSHRVLRYATPALHAVALATSIALVALGAGAIYVAALAIQLAVLAAALAAARIRARPLLIARYYVLTTTALAAGLLDWLRHGTDAAWEAAEGTR